MCWTDTRPPTSITTFHHTKTPKPKDQKTKRNMQFNTQSTRVFRDNYAFMCAAHEGDLGKMRFLKDSGHELGEDQEDDINIFRAAARNGNVENIAWLRNNSCDFGDDPFSEANSDLRVFEWLWYTGYSTSSYTFLYVLENAFRKTDTSNQLEVLEWLKNHGCDMSKKTYKTYNYSNCSHKDQINTWLLSSGANINPSPIDFKSEIGMEIAEYIFSDVSPYGKIEYDPKDSTYDRDIDPHYEGAYGLMPGELFSISSPVSSEVSSDMEEDIDPEKEQYLKMIADLGCVGQFLIKK